MCIAEPTGLLVFNTRPRYSFVTVALRCDKCDEICPGLEYHSWMKETQTQLLHAIVDHFSARDEMWKVCMVSSVIDAAWRSHVCRDVGANFSPQ